MHGVTSGNNAPAIFASLLKSDFTVAVHHRYPHIQMIILSGYDNFEYVKQTLMQGVVDYNLLKEKPSHRMSFLACFKKRQRGFPAGIRIMQ